MSKKFYLLALIVTVAFMGLDTTDLSADYVCGDANGDGVLNVSDAVFIVNHVFIGGPAPDSYCCDECPATVTDYDGNVYETVEIGNQCWMKENLKVIHYNNGVAIPHRADDFNWQYSIGGAYCNYDNNEANVAIYGRLYNGYAAQWGDDLAPEGWHVATDADWDTLVNYLGGPTAAGGKLKEAGTAHWQSPNTGATNESAFTALPGGNRGWDGTFFGMGEYAEFWSSTSDGLDNAWRRYLTYIGTTIHRNSRDKNYGQSVRCVRYITKNLNRADYVCGDANGDGTLNVSDAVFIINHVFVGGPAPDPNCCPDCPPTVTDYDGNVYQTALIGGQCWMAENLKVIHYQDGSSIPNVTNDDTWENLTSGAYCNYENNGDNVAVYGRLYNWFAINDSRNIAPEGWHVPTDAEWKQLEMYLGMSQAEADAEGYRGTDEGGKLKEPGTTHWWAPNEGATNETGFTALPGGLRRMPMQPDSWSGMGTGGFFWSSTEVEPGGYLGTAYERTLGYGISTIKREPEPKRLGLSIRCVKD
jgi:uncharacterized protein (TIGR02145 family)